MTTAATPFRVTFYVSGSAPVHGRTLEQRALGGTETGVIRLSESLAEMGAEVTVIGPHPNPPLTSVLYVPPHSAQDLPPQDALIAVRDWQTLLLPIPARKRYFWTGDSYDQLQNWGIGDLRIASRIDALLAVSDWQAVELSRRSLFPPEKIAVIRNGVQLDLFKGSEERVPKRLIYTTTPFRGLEHLEHLFPVIRLRHPDAELHLFTGFEVYRDSGFPEAVVRQYQPLLARLAQEQRVVLHGNVSQSNLARELMRSSIYLYPNTFEETSCISALEAQAAGCVMITTARAALPESVGSAGILIPGEPGTPSYDRAFIEAADSLLTDRLLWERYSQQALHQAKSSGWDKVAERLMTLLAA